jgi:hypothetical protein
MSGGVGADRKRGRKVTAPARYPILVRPLSGVHTDRDASPGSAFLLSELTSNEEPSTRSHAR